MTTNFKHSTANLCSGVKRRSESSESFDPVHSSSSSFHPPLCRRACSVLRNESSGSVSVWASVPHRTTSHQRQSRNNGGGFTVECVVPLRTSSTHLMGGRCVLPPSSFCVARLIAAESPARRAFTGKRVTFAADRRLLFSPRLSHGHIPEKNLCSEFFFPDSLVFLIISFQLFFFHFLTFATATPCVLILGLNVKDEGSVSRTNNTMTNYRIASLLK